MSKKIKIYAYKHDGSFHRNWTSSEILVETKDYFITYTPSRIRVLESNNNSWGTKEPAIGYFSKKRWFNITIIYRNDEIMYYCNLASPILKELNSLKYIDYDLDVKYYVNADSMKILDKNEYQTNKLKYDYPEWIDKKVQKELKVLVSWLKHEVGPFSEEFRQKWYKEVIKERNE